MAIIKRKVLKLRGYCIHKCGRSVREIGTECRKCRRQRRLKGLRIRAKQRRASNQQSTEA